MNSKLLQKPLIHSNDVLSIFFCTNELGRMLSGKVGGWLVIKRVHRFSSKSGIVTSRMCWFRIWYQKLSTALRSKVTCKLNLKFFKVNFRDGNQLKKWWSQKTSPRGANWRKFSKRYFIENKTILGKNIKKTQSPKMTSKVV